MSVTIAPIDWDHAAWTGSFYPSDLPAEWRLAYFANEFAAVVLPPERWHHADAAQVRQWLDDTPPRFRFYLEVADNEDVPVALRELLAERWGGVLGTGLVHEGWSGPAEPRGLRAVLERLAAAGGGVLVVEGDSPAIEVLRTARTLSELLGL